MDIRVLRYFLVVVQKQNISAAATALYMSQPALSRQMTQLEQELGVQLFKRGPRKIKLTQAGYYLHERAIEITNMIDKTTYNLQSRQKIISGQLDIGAGESSGMQRIMDVVANILKDHPQVQIHLRSGDAEDIKPQLEAGVLDFGVMMGALDLSQYNQLQLPEVDHWGIILPSDAPLAKKQVITPADLLGQPLIVSQQAQKHARFQRWWHNTAAQINIIGTFNLIYNAALLVKNGGCYALSFDHLTNTDDNSGLAFRRLAPPLTEPITVIWKKHHTHSTVAELFLQRLRANVAEKGEKPENMTFGDYS